MDTKDIKVTGSVMFYRLYDVCWESDLRLVESRVEGAKRLKMERKRFGKAFEFTNPPVGIVIEDFERELAGSPRTLKAYGKVYDYGAMSVILELPVADVTMAELESLAREVRSESPFEEDFPRLRDRLINTLGDALEGKGTPSVEEEYTVYYVRSLSQPMTAAELRSGFDLRGLLLSEVDEPAPGDAVARELSPYTFSYSDSDLVTINWDNAFVYEPSGVMDIPDLLEFANAQLLELRVYDQLLDRELDTIYLNMSRKAASIWKVRRYQRLATKVMKTFTELMYITEKVDNSLKVTDDVFYAKVYAAALDLFKVKAWETSIRKKFDIASRAYEMLTQAISNRRNEILEVVIIALIAIEIVFFVLWEFNR